MSATHHFLTQKFTSAALLLLTPWLLCALYLYAQSGNLVDVLGNPVHAIFALIYTLLAYVHFYGHLKEVIDDYVHCGALRIGITFLSQLGALVACVATLYGILFISLLGGQI